MKKQMGLLCCVLLVGLIGSVCYGGENGLTLEQAIDRLDVAIERSSETGSHSDVLEAAAGLGFVLERDGIESAQGHLALGNAYFIGDDLGRAIVAYRRGLLIEPGNVELLENLEYARSFVEPRVPDDGEGWSFGSMALSWLGVIDRWVVWYGAVLSVGLASCLMTAGWFGARVPKMAAVTAGIVGVMGFGLLGFDWWTIGHDRGVVVVEGGTGLYSGPGVGVYQLVYEGSLGVGSEGEVLEEREGWIRVRLGNGQVGWLDAGSSIRVNRILD